MVVNLLKSDVKGEVNDLDDLTESVFEIFISSIEFIVNNQYGRIMRISHRIVLEERSKKYNFN